MTRAWSIVMTGPTELCDEKVRENTEVDLEAPVLELWKQQYRRSHV